MELISVMIPKKSKKDIKGESTATSMYDSPQYPYGLQLRFETEQFDKIASLDKYKVGNRVIIQAEAVVTSISMSERQSGKADRDLSMQIEKIACSMKDKKAPEKMSLKEYRAMRE